jgi:putative ABC transport system permease protein
MIQLTFPDVLWASLLVAISLGIAAWWKIPVKKDMAIGSIRAFIQLTAVGYALKYIFGLESIWLMSLAILTMTVIGAHTAAARLTEVKHAYVITFLSISLSASVTLGLLLLLDIISLEPRYMIPLSGMMISNSMNSTALTMNRIVSDLRQNREAIESALALGKSWRVASHKYQKSAVIAGMISLLNFLKTAGIVALPGAMTGMILAGAEPVQAIMLQIIVAYMLTGAATISSVVSLELTVRRFFTPQHQLILD